MPGQAPVLEWKLRCHGMRQWTVVSSSHQVCHFCFLLPWCLSKLSNTVSRTARGSCVCLPISKKNILYCRMSCMQKEENVVRTDKRAAQTLSDSLQR